MELLKDLNGDCSFTDKIKESKYVEKATKDKATQDKATQDKATQDKATQDKATITKTNTVNKNYNSFRECIVSEFDPILQTLNFSEKKLYLAQKMMAICSKIDESDAHYHDYQFNEKITKSQIIQQGLNSNKRDNHISSIYYLNEFYKRHFVIVHQNIAYDTTLKNYPKVYLGIGHGIRVIDEFDDSDETKGNLNDLFDKIPLINDIKKDMKHVYIMFLDPISKYKMDDLKKIAEDCNLSLKDGNKNKVKGKLYDEINLYKLNE